MKTISYHHKKLAAEKDSKKLRSIYLRAVKDDAEQSIGPGPEDREESRLEFFTRLNNHINENADEYDKKAPFTQASIQFVKDIPEEELEMLQKSDRTNFTKWIASNYEDYKNILTLDNVLKIRSIIISRSNNHSFSKINENTPDYYLGLLESSSDSESSSSGLSYNLVLNNLNIKSDDIAESSRLFKEEAGEDILALFSEEEVLFLKIGSSLFGNPNDLTLVFDFIIADNSDIEISKPGDLSKLYPFNINDLSSIESGYKSIFDAQDLWHKKMAESQSASDKYGGKYGYGYLTNKVIYEFGDGWKIVYLPANTDPDMIPWSEDPSLSHDRIQEGDNNGICLGSSLKLYNDNEKGYIYSLRNPQNKPIATILAQSKLEGDLSDAGYGFFPQLYGKANSKPGIEPSIYLKEFFGKLNIRNIAFDRHLANTDIDSLSKIKETSNSAFSFEKSEAIENMFDWIYFLNKKRAKRSEREKYSEYMEHYDNLISLRSDIFSRYDGDYISEASIFRDEARLRKYIFNIFDKIIKSGSSKWMKEELIGKLLGKDTRTSWKILFEKIISKHPSYKSVYEIMSTQRPAEVYHFIVDNQWSLDLEVKEICKISAEILISGGYDYIEKFFKPILSGFSFFDLNEFDDYYKRKEVIAYLEELFQTKSDKFTERKLYNIYYGNNEEIKTLLRVELNKELDTKIKEVTKNPSWALYPWNHIDKALSIGLNFFDPNMIKNLIDFMENKWILNQNKKLPLNFSEKKYLLILREALKKHYDYTDNDFLTKNNEIALSLLKDNISNLGDYVKANKENYNKIIDIFNNIIFAYLDYNSEELVLGIKKLISDKVSEIKSKKESKDNQITFYFYDKIAKYLNQKFDGEFLDIINLIGFSEEEFKEASLLFPKAFFGNKLNQEEELKEFSKSVIFEYIRSSMYTKDLNWIGSSAVNNESNEFSLIIEEVASYIDVKLLGKELVNSILEYKKDLKNFSADDKNSRKNSTSLCLNFVVIQSRLESLKAVEVIKDFVDQAASIFEETKANISDIFYLNPEVYFEHNFDKIKGISVDKKRLVISLIDNLVKRKFYDAETASNVMSIISELIGISKQAKKLGHFLIKNSFIEEFRDLIKLYEVRGEQKI